MKAAVTGASGFIGSYLVNELMKQGHHVTALTRSEAALAHIRKKKNTLVIGSVTDPDSVRKLCQGQDCVFHGAAIVSGYGSWDQYYRIGVLGTENVINAAVKLGVERFIHLSSLTVYGTLPHTLPVTESMLFDQQLQKWNHYVRQKILSERLVWSAHNDGRILATVFRPSLVLGPGDRNVVAQTLRYIQSPLRAIIGSGDNLVACVVVDELSRIIVKSALLQSAIGKAYNLSGAKQITQMDYLNLHALAAGLPRLQRKVPLSLARICCKSIAPWRRRISVGQGLVIMDAQFIFQLNGSLNIRTN
jgi:nucleoside-diphosphate-sugar epimerase